MRSPAEFESLLAALYFLKKEYRPAEKKCDDDEYRDAAGNDFFLVLRAVFRAVESFLEDHILNFQLPIFNFQKNST
ncbi:hypothetical protein C4556_02945 [Candidatus Parcubacteria bacterium]|nr:MAG: hypothetical protein C4556_02945 [Candidatus Parcubacteria bacterium]